MPTYDAPPNFLNQHSALAPDQKKRFRTAVDKFVSDLRKGQGLNGVRPGLRVKGVRGAEGLYEMTWAPDGRAVFTLGPSRKGGEPHVIWLAVGTHAVLP